MNTPAQPTQYQQCGVYDKPNKSNAERLKEFCSGKKGKEDKDELLKFYNFYIAKVDSFKSFNPEKQWEKWCTN